jgi:hypothetical protein
MGFLKKLGYWIRRRDGAVSKKHSEVHRENIEEGNTNTEDMLRSRIAGPLEGLDERDREEDKLRHLKNQAESEMYGWISIYTNQLKAEISKRNQMEATFRDTIVGLEKQLEETKCLKNEAEASLLEANLKKQLKETDSESDHMVGTYPDMITALEEELEEAACLNNQAEAKMCDLKKRLKQNVSKRYLMKATFGATVVRLEKQLEEAKCLKNETEANLKKKLEEKDRERDQMEATYREKILILEKKLKEQFLKNEAEDNLHGREKQSKEKDSERDHMEGTYHDKIIALEKELEAAKCLKNEAEAKMRGLEKKLKEKDSKRYQMKATYRDKITGLRKKLKEEVSERDQVMRTLRGHIEEEREANLFAEATLHSEKRLVERAMEETERHCIQVETMLRGQISQTEELKRKLQKRMCFQEKMRDWKNVEKALRGQIKQLKETVSLMESDKEKVIDALPCDIKTQTDAQQQPDGFQADIFLNSRIKELDEMLQEQMNIHGAEKRDWKNVEKALRGQIKQLKNTIAVMESDRTPTVVILTPKPLTWKLW